MKIFRLIVILFSIQLLNGCGTYASLEHRQSTDPVIFGGVRTNANYIKYPTNRNSWLQKQAVYSPYLDFPFSAFSDVILLPFSISYAVVN